MGSPSPVSLTSTHAAPASSTPQQTEITAACWRTYAVLASVAQEAVQTDGLRNVNEMRRLGMAEPTPGH